MVGIDWYAILYNLLHMLAAYALAFPIGCNRERTAKSAGIHTFPLVAWDRFEIAILLAVANYLTLRLVRRLKSHLEKGLRRLDEGKGITHDKGKECVLE